MLLPARAAFAYALVDHLAEMLYLPCEIFCTSSRSFSVSGVHRRGTPVRVLEEGRYLANSKELRKRKRKNFHRRVFFDFWMASAYGNA